MNYRKYVGLVGETGDSAYNTFFNVCLPKNINTVFTGSFHSNLIAFCHWLLSHCRYSLPFHWVYNVLHCWYSLYPYVNQEWNTCFWLRWFYSGYKYTNIVKQQFTEMFPKTTVTHTEFDKQISKHWPINESTKKCWGLVFCQKITSQYFYH